MKLLSKFFGLEEWYHVHMSTLNFQNWIQRLRPYCVNTAPVSQQRLSALKELRSLTVEVVDAQKLSTKLLPHPYCILNLKNPGQNPIKVCRTQVEEGHNPVWEEKFILEWVLNNDRVILDCRWLLLSTAYGYFKQVKIYWSSFVIRII